MLVGILGGFSWESLEGGPSGMCGMKLDLHQRLVTSKNLQAIVCGLLFLLIHQVGCHAHLRNHGLMRFSVKMSLVYACLRVHVLA